MKQVVHFSYDIVPVARTVLQIFIDKHNQKEKDISKKMASNEMIYHLLMDEDIEKLLCEWCNINNGKTTLFENGLEDAEQIWNIIWTEEKFKTLLKEYICKGYSGNGVYDKRAEEFYPCKFSEHYDTIKFILKTNYPYLWKMHQECIKNSAKDTSAIDQFILNELILVGNRFNKDYYTLSERMY